MAEIVFLGTTGSYSSQRSDNTSLPRGMDRLKTDMPGG